jgi:hypothetical protein
MTFEFPDPKLERMVTLTPSDRKWMDDVVRMVEETYGGVSLLQPDIHTIAHLFRLTVNGPSESRLIEIERSTDHSVFEGVMMI